MASVRTLSLLYSVILSVSGLWSDHHEDYQYGGYGGRYHRRPGVRRRVVVIRERAPERRVHVTHEVRHVPAVLDTCHGCHGSYEGSVSVVRDHHHVVVDHGGADYLPAPRVAVAVEPRPVVAVAAAPAVVTPLATPAVVPAAGGSRIDPR